MLKRTLLTLILGIVCLSLIECHALQLLKSDLETNLSQHVRFLSSDSLEGRLVGTDGIEKSADYIISAMGEMGISPLFNGSWRQVFEVNLGITASDSSTVTLNGKTLTMGRDFQVIPASPSCKVEARTFFGESAGRESGAVICLPISEEIESQRWGYPGHDRLLDWMTRMCDSLHSLGAVSVIFYPDQESKEELHWFAQKPRYRQCPICAVEIKRASLLKAIGKDEIPSQGQSMDQAIQCKIDISTKPRSVKTSNIGGVIKGKKRPGCYVVIGAHYDHLGYGDIASATPWRREIHGGADDNASGVAGLLEIARILNRDPIDCSCAIVFFSAEEIGAAGSEHFVRNPPFPIDSMIAMINLDTIGRLEDQRLIVFGAYSAIEFEKLIKDCSEKCGIKPVLRKETYGASDQNPFYARGIPSLHLFTGAHQDYHSPEDTWQQLNYQGLRRIVEFTVELASLISKNPITPVVSTEEEQESGSAKGAFLGIVPDFAYTGTGVGIKACLGDSPAQRGGLVGGDVILEVDGNPIADLKTLSRILSTRQPGDEVEIKILRDSNLMLKKVTLGTRKQN